MRPNLSQNISASNAATTNGQTIPAQFVVAVSAQAVSTGTPTGTVKLQMSNDLQKGLASDENGNLIPVNWTDISGASASISSAGSVVIPKIDSCYAWLRAVYTDTAANVSEITAVADVSGSLNSTYFFAYSTTAKYYVWFDDGSGVDPAPAGYTGIHVIYSSGATASTLGGLIRSAATADWTVTGSGANAILTNAATGPSLPAADSTAAPTGFTFTNTQPTGTVTVNVNTLGF